MQIARSHWTAAGWVAIAYMAIQSFQHWAFSVLPEDATTALDHPVNIARATLMLFSFFGLAYLFLVICATNAQRAPIASIAAFLGLFVFCLLEVVLRSIELFWVLLAQPALPAATRETFQAVQGAVYFPLGFVQLLASVLLAATLRGPWSTWARVAFGINALRLALRQLDVYVIGDRFGGVYDVLYLPLVFVVFGGMAVWLFKGREPR